MMLKRAGAVKNFLSGINIAAAVLLLLPVIALLPSLGGFPYPSAQSQFSDFTVSHYPNALYLQKMLSDGEIPLWSPLILSGYPFFASPLSGLWYPPGWLALLLPLPFGLNLVLLLHLLFAGAGQYLLVRRQGLSQLPAVLAGMAFVGVPKLAAHLGAGHVTLIYAVAWTPWLLLMSSRSREKGGSGIAVVLALITLADPRWLPYAAGLWIWYEVFFHSKERSWQKQIKDMSFQAAAGLLLSAPLLAPLWEYTSVSSRGAMTAKDVFEYSLPWDGLLGLVFPPPGGFHEWMLSPGVLVLVLALTALLVVQDRETDWKVRSWGLLVLICLLWAMGNHIPGLAQLANLPVLRWLRVPARSLFLVGMGLGILAAYGLQAILQGVDLKTLSRLRLFIFAAMAAVAGIGFGAQVLAGRVLPPFLWGMSAILIASGMILYGVSRNPVPPQWIAGMLLLTALELGIFGRTLVDWRTSAEVLSEGAAVAQSITRISEGEGAGDYRIYSPSYSVPQHTAAVHGLELADGVEPLQWQPYVDYMAAATGVPALGYSVTLPAFADGQPAAANQSYQPEAVLLGWLNVRYVTSEYELQAEGLEWVKDIGATRVYRNRYAMPRAWVQKDTQAFPGEVFPVIELSREPDRVDVRAEGEGLLVLADLAYPGWEAHLDGKNVPVLTHQGILRAVELPPGEHLVSFVFRPMSLKIGLFLFLVAVALLGGRTWRARRVHG